MKNIIIISCSIVLYLCFNDNCFAQLQMECGNTESISTPPAKSSVECDDWINYAPIISEHTPVKKVRITLHVIQKADSTGNFPDNQTSRDWLLNKYISDVNSVMADLDTMNLTTTSPYIQDSRIRYVVDTIYFQQDAQY